MNEPLYTTEPTFEGDWRCTVEWPQGGLVGWYSSSLMAGREQADKLIAEWRRNVT